MAKNAKTATPTIVKSHGRRENRSITVAAWSADRLRELGWTEVRQVFELVHIRQLNDNDSMREVVYGFTSLDANLAGPERLLELCRGH